MRNRPFAFYRRVSLTRSRLARALLRLHVRRALDHLLQLREIDRRIHYLTKRLETATVVGPADREASALDRVFLGAAVAIEDEDGNEIVYRIVGADEIDLASRCISYVSPIGRALLKKKVGDTSKNRASAMRCLYVGLSRRPVLSCHR